jgi:transposase-like protein
VVEGKLSQAILRPGSSDRWTVPRIDLRVPKVRQGSYFPDWLLEPRRRAERALAQVVCECYVLGVSTRAVDDLVRVMGLNGMSKSQVSDLAKELDGLVDAFRNRPLDAAPYPYLWLDAHSQRVREGGRVVSVAVVVATAVNAQGHREILGCDAVTTEDGAGWVAFLRSLVARGLRGVKLVISDSHEGLKNAIAATLPGAAWQRCRTHFARNVLTRVHKNAQGMVASIIRSIFEQSSPELVHEAWQRAVETLKPRFPIAARLLEDARTDILAFTTFPPEHWRKIWSNNPMERLNKEIRRRTDVVGIFPNRAAILRLVGALLAEQNDEWCVMRSYMEAGTLKPLLEKPGTAQEAIEPYAAMALS